MHLLLPGSMPAGFNTDEAAEEGRAKLMGEDMGDSDWEHIVVVGLFGGGLKTE